MNTIGYALKKTREDKGLSLTALAEGILSKSQLSKIERDLSDISAYKLFLLLKRLNISWSEFSLLIDSNDSSQSQQLLEEITQAALTFNTAKISFFEKKVENIFIQQKHSNHRLELIMIRSLKCQLNHTQLEQDDAFFLIDYLFKVENWTRFELVLYGNTMSFLPLETVNLLSKEIANRTLLFDSINHSVIINLLFNTVILNLMHCNKVQATHFLRLMENAPFLDIQLGEKFLKEFAHALYQYKFENKKEAEEKILFLLRILTTLKSDDLYLFMFDTFQSVK